MENQRLAAAACAIHRSAKRLALASAAIRRGRPAANGAGEIPGWGKVDPMGRKKIIRSPSAVNLSGPLGPALEAHARERMRHFFLFLFAVDATCRLASVGQPAPFRPSSMIQEAATVQVDTGMRGSLQDYDKFDETNANVVHLPATSFTAIDAAHFCNLGLKSGPWASLTTAAETLADNHAIDLLEYAEVFTGDTAQLPQRVNIGPDRIIDQLHYILALEFLGDGQPVLTPQRLQRYAGLATAQMVLYRDGNGMVGKAGLIACCDCYVRAYATSSLEEVYRVTGGNITSECQARSLPAHLFVL